MRRSLGRFLGTVFSISLIILVYFGAYRFLNWVVDAFFDSVRQRFFQ